MIYVFICPALTNGKFMICSQVTGNALRTDNIFGSDCAPIYFDSSAKAMDYLAKLNSRNSVRSYAIAN